MTHKEQTAATCRTAGPVAVTCMQVLMWLCLSLDLQMLIVMATWIIMEQDLLKVCVVCLHTSVCAHVCACKSVCVCVCVRNPGVCDCVRACVHLCMKAWCVCVCLQLPSNQSFFIGKLPAT